MTDWTAYQHPEYKDHLPQWVWARDHYRGEVTMPSKVTNYLVRKVTAETEPAWRERCLLADYTPHFSTVVDSLAGMLHSNPDDDNRVWGTDTNPGLGDEEDPTTPIGRLWQDMDGQGTGYPTLYKQLTTDLIAVHTYWVLVDSVDGNPQVRLLPPECVTNWLEGPSGMIEVLVTEEADSRTSLEQDPKDKEVTRYIRYTVQGWQRYEERQTAHGKETQALTGAENTGTYTFADRSKKPALPIFRITLPLRRMVGWILAKKANAIFNKESERDHLLRYANFPKLCLDAADDILFKKISEDIGKGTSVLQGANHTFIAPDTGPATIATEVLKRKVEEFYITAFREYGDAGRQRTATEVRHDVSSGVGAFLQMVNAAITDAENEVLWRVEQILFPKNPEKWFVATVRRSNEFIPHDINDTIERTRTWFFGKDKMVPMGRTAQIAAAKQVADYAGIEVVDAEIEAAVDLQNLLNAKDLLRDEPVPASAKGLLVVKIMEAIGVLNPEEMVSLADGSTTKLRDLILSDATKLAEAQDQNAQNAGNFFNTPPDPNAQKQIAPPDPMLAKNAA